MAASIDGSIVCWTVSAAVALISRWLASRSWLASQASFVRRRASCAHINHFTERLQPSGSEGRRVVRWSRGVGAMLFVRGFYNVFGEFDNSNIVIEDLYDGLHLNRTGRAFIFQNQVCLYDLLVCCRGRV